MKISALTIVQSGPHQSVRAFREAMENREFIYTAGHLKRHGFATREEIQHALRRSICICKSMDIPVRKHFRYFYLSNKQIVSREWKMSKLGFYLILANGPASNPYTAAFQMEMLRDIYGRL